MNNRTIGSSIRGSSSVGNGSTGHNSGNDVNSKEAVCPHPHPSPPSFFSVVGLNCCPCSSFPVLSFLLILLSVYLLTSLLVFIFLTVEPFPTDEDPLDRNVLEPIVLLLMLQVSSITRMHYSNDMVVSCKRYPFTPDIV